MTEIQEKIKVCIDKAIDKFNLQEQYLISRDLSERCICAKFAVYLDKVIAESEFSDYVVDVEYNRGYSGNEYVAKRLHGRKIVVDLIVHKRGYDNDSGFDNLICIEMKKARCSNLLSDKERLSIMTDKNYGFKYKAGYMIVIVANNRLHEYGLKIDEEFYS